MILHYCDLLRLPRPRRACSVERVIVPLRRAFSIIRSTERAHWYLHNSVNPLSITGWNRHSAEGSAVGEALPRVGAAALPRGSQYRGGEYELAQWRIVVRRDDGGLAVLQQPAHRAVGVDR